MDIIASVVRKSSVQAMKPSAGQPGLFEVDGHTIYWNKNGLVPELGLRDDMSYGGRVYVLRCAPQIVGGAFTHYVGYARNNKVGGRIAKQARQEGAKYPEKYKPLSVELVWPVANRAAEAHVYYALVDQLPEGAVMSGRLGGWTQTLPRVSPLMRFQLKREKRMVSGQCLDCGAKCFAGECEKPVETIDYACDHCSAVLRVGNQGKTMTVPPAVCRCPGCCSKRPRADDNMAAPPMKAQRSEVVQAPAARVIASGRSSGASSSSSPSGLAPVAAQGVQNRGDRCCKVLVGGVKYTCLAWYLQISQPYPKHRHAVLADSTACEFAVQMDRGDGKTLVGNGLAKSPPNHARELLAEGESLDYGWAKTKCGVRVKRCRQVEDLAAKLFRVEDLKKVPKLNS